MARTSTTFDTFNAIAEPKRRALIEALAGKELTVNQTGELMGWNQPMVSKHLGVLKQVGIVSERREGRFRVYKVNAAQLIFGRRSLAGSLIGGITETQDMLNFCGEKNILSEVEVIRMDEINEAFERMRQNDVKYRFVIDLASLA